ncbi:MAG: alanine--glyoxylate aminotransferase family protein [Candidatus Acidiferrales bacterium]
MTTIGELAPPKQLLLTSGPSSMDPRVYHAIAKSLVSHMDPWFATAMTEVQALLRAVFQTQNRITYPISSSGSGGIEASVVNPLEEGDEALICVNGMFSDRIAVIAERTPAKVTRLEVPYGKTVDPDDVRRAGKGKKIKIVALTHGETSSGVIQDIDGFRKVADELGALLVVDTVATLSAVPLDVDRERIDICFSASQKALSAPPGLAPITVSTRAEEAIRARKTKVLSWYFDLRAAMDYWGKDRLYHHTPPIMLIYALHEALRIVLEEGLEARWVRHRQNQQALIAGLEAMGLELLVKNPAERLPTVTAVKVPEGVDDAKVRGRLLQEFNIEISGGLGLMKNKIWRVGLLGHSSQRPHVLRFLEILEKVLLGQGYHAAAGTGVAAAVHSYAQAETPDTVVK